ncbi:DUF4347 domain-containing protein, partial [Ramlibacter sp.]|uniref:DUF4347 domain-containing protein n=1 Tax=Ramlibacter sp. TaxID=1917967 RepID=UPI00180F7BC9
MTTISSSSSFVISGGPANLQDPDAQQQDAALDVSLVPMSALLGPELVFIESNVADAALLMQSMQAAGKEVYLLDTAQDGLRLISSVLEGREGISALHLVTHGGEGWIDLGATRLDTDAVAARQADLQAIGSHLSADADILLYGCDVGAGAGPSFVQAVAAATGADVAASSDTTGAASLGGDWELEIRSGDVEVQPAVDASLAELYGHVLALSGVTAAFGTGAGNNFTSVGGYSTAAQDVTYKVSGDAAYALKVDGALDGAYAYANRVYVADNGTENLVTFSFAGGKIFTPSSMLVVNTAAYIPAQTLVFKGYDSGGGLVATQNLSVGAGVTPTTINFSGFTNIATLKLTASTNGNLIKWLYLDDLVFTTVQSPDTTPPTISGITSSTTDGTYKVGDVIAVKVNFSEAVNVTGTPQITLETGATDRVVGYSSGSGTSTLTFNYTVQAGDTTADLDYISTTALALNGGTIKDLAGNAGVLTLPAPAAANSLGANKALVIDGIVPTVTGVSSSTSNGAYKAGDVISVQVNFSEAVTVTGTPQLTLETGTTDRVVNYASGTGTNSLTFTYTVQAGDTTADLDYISTAALALNAGTIKDAAGNNATLTLASPGAANSLGANKNIVVDTAVPTVSGVTSSTTNGAYKVGDVISVQVNFSEAVAVTGTPQLTLETGTTDRVVNYASGTGTNSLTFTYTVQAGDTTADLDYISTAALALNGGTIADVAGNNATLTLAAPGAANSLGANKAIVIDTAVPTVSGVTSSTANGAYKVGDVISVQVNFSEAVNVTGTPQLTLET